MPKMSVREFKHGLPVIKSDLVFSRTVMEANSALDQLPRCWLREFGRGEPVRAEQSINWIGGERGQELTFGISAEIVLCGTYQDRARCQKRDQLMLVDG
jgi:hypothetical protein